VSGKRAVRRRPAHLPAPEGVLPLALAAGRMGTWEWDIASGRVTWSPELEAMHGLTPGAFDGTFDGYQRDIHPDDREPVLSALRRTLEQGDDRHQIEYRIVRPDGTLCWVEGRGHLVRDAEGRPARMVGVCLDVTERKNAEHALRESEARFRELADTAPVLIWLNGLEGAEFVNRTYREFLGVEDDDVRGLEWALFVHPDDRAEYLGAYRAAQSGGEPFEAEFRFRRFDGQYRWMRSVGVPRRGAGGELLGYVGSTIDITDQRRAVQGLRVRARQQHAVARLGELAIRERDLQRVLDFATGVVAETLEVEYCKVLELLPQGREVLLRAGVGWRDGLVGTARVSTGLDSQAGYTLMSDAPVVVDDFQTEVRFSGPYLLTEHGVVSGMSCVIRTRAGPPWGVLGTHSTRRIVFTDDDVNFLVAVANTLGEAIERDRAERALREADRRKDEFLATLAHELRNPLAPLRNGLQVMKLAEGDPEAIEQARAMMDRQLTHMVRLIDDLLDLGRITQGKVTLRRELVQLAALVHQAVETSRTAIERAGHELIIGLPAEQIWVEADATRLAQVFANLLNNAAKFTDRGGQIRLSVQRLDHEAAVSVRDTGVGIPEEMLGRVFDMFTQVDRSLERERGGLGIGLSLVKQMVGLHGGTVEARSAGPGTGSEFVVRLPTASPPANERARGGSDDLLHATVPQRILVVDDNQDAAESLAMVLGIMGHETRTAHDGATAIGVAAAFEPEVILLDIGMPRLNGYDTVRHIRDQEWGRNAMVVAVTGWGQEHDQRRSRDAGFDHHLVKPVDLGQLMQLITAPWSRRRSGPHAARFGSPAEPAV
jgi:PAS domain S-box-containing protein